MKVRAVFQTKPEKGREKKSVAKGRSKRFASPTCVSYSVRAGWTGSDLVSCYGEMEVLCCLHYDAASIVRVSEQTRASSRCEFFLAFRRTWEREESSLEK